MSKQERSENQGKNSVIINKLEPITPNNLKSKRFLKLISFRKIQILILKLYNIFLLGYNEYWFYSFLLNEIIKNKV